MTTATEAKALTTQVYQVFIKATAQQIWEAITNPEFTHRYFHGTHVTPLRAVGEPWQYLDDDETVLVDGELVEADAPRRLVHTWRAQYRDELAPEPASRVTWEIDEQSPGMCLLTVVHDRLESSPKTAASVSGTGWMMVLSGLKTLLETGSPLQI